MNTRRSTLLAAQAALNSAVIASNSARLNNITIPSSSSSISKSLMNGNNKLNRLSNVAAQGLVSNSTNYTGVLNNYTTMNQTAQQSPQSSTSNPIRRSTRSSSNALNNTASSQKRYCT